MFGTFLSNQTNLFFNFIRRVNNSPSSLQLATIIIFRRLNSILLYHVGSSIPLSTPLLSNGIPSTVSIYIAIIIINTPFLQRNTYPVASCRRRERNIPYTFYNEIACTNFIIIFSPLFFPKT